MSKKQLFVLILSSLVILFCLMVTWEFLLEPYINSASGTEEESYSERWEYVLTSMTLAALALLIPIWQGLKQIARNVETDRLLKEGEKKFHQAQKLEALGTMINGIAHELNNVLQGIFLYGEILENQISDEKSKTSLKAIMDNTEHAKKIVSQIMIFSHQSETNFKTYSLQSILRESIELQRALMSSQFEIIEEYKADRSQIRCDLIQMQQILMNLYNNAHSAMPDGGKLTIRLKEIISPDENGRGVAKQGQTFLELSISDTGVGMDEETLQKVFDPFFTTKEIGEGTGLGMSVTHGLIEQMGGTITVTSEKGVGSTFTIHLPIICD
ncbi:MAG: hypothetical protein K9N35_03925 [Candidatus Marinimicrobia bacterium]|nr:hypothetical protein [Candidatus Neomarinimicrobiota bacterium]